MIRLREYVVGAVLLLAVFGLTACDNASSNNDSASSNDTSSTSETNNTSSNDQSTHSQTDESTTTNTTSAETTTQTANNVTETSNNTEAQASDKVQLRLNLKEGDTFRVRMTQNQELEQTMFGQSTSTTSTSVTVMKFEVVSVDADGNMTVTSTYESLQSREEGPNGVNEFDSTQAQSSANNPQAEVMMAMVGQSLEMVYTPTSELLRVDGFGEILDAMLSTQDPAMAEITRPVIESIFGEEAFRSMMQSMMMPFSDTPVGAGDSWLHHVEISTGLPMITDITFTVTDIVDGVLSADTAGTVTANADAPPMKLGPLELTYPELSGTSDGVIRIDTNTGWVVYSRTTNEIAGEMLMEGLGDLGEAPPIPIAAKTEIIMEMLTE